jgi:hypothetical protein
MMARPTLAALTVLVLLTSGCMSGSGGGKDADVSSSASPKRYEDDPDKPKRVCESTMEGNEPKTICY